jgi:hypothetical protein
MKRVIDKMTDPFGVPSGGEWQRILWGGLSLVLIAAVLGPQLSAPMQSVLFIALSIATLWVVFGGKS